MSLPDTASAFATVTLFCSLSLSICSSVVPTLMLSPHSPRAQKASPSSLSSSQKQQHLLPRPTCVLH
ncbi:hypothetical protein BDV06DRAFT_195274, partial [Aspergillus oleicola]